MPASTSSFFSTAICTMLCTSLWLTCHGQFRRPAQLENSANAPLRQSAFASPTAPLLGFVPAPALTVLLEAVLVTEKTVLDAEPVSSVTARQQGNSLLAHRALQAGRLPAFAAGAEHRDRWWWVTRTKVFHDRSIKVISEFEVTCTSRITCCHQVPITSALPLSSLARPLQVRCTTSSALN